MDQHDQDREVRIGVGLLLGMAVFALIALGKLLFPPVATDDIVTSRMAHSSR